MGDARRKAVERGWTVVSGLALGIDTEAHLATLDAGGRTVAVLGSGVDKITRTQNRSLADRIVEHGGAILTEQPFGMPPTRPSLVQRNRITSGLCSAVVLVESGLTGGSMQTVRFAILQHRQVFAAVPEDPIHPSADALTRLTCLDGPHLSACLNATGEYARVLSERFRTSPAVSAVRKSTWLAG